MAQTSQINSPIQLRLPEIPESELPEAVRSAFEQLYVSIWNIVRAFQEQCGVGGWPQSDWSQVVPAQSLIIANNNRLYVQATEAINFGAIINLHDSGGLRVRNANATNNSRYACGYCSTAGGIASGAFGEVIFGNGLVNIAGATPGIRYFLSTTNGLLTATAPAAAGNIRQFVGVGISGSLIMYASSGDFAQL